MNPSSEPLLLTDEEAEKMAMAHDPDQTEFKSYSARTPLPPGYVVQRVEDHWCWVRLSDDAESSIHWSHWACWRGAWAHHRSQQEPQ